MEFSNYLGICKQESDFSGILLRLYCKSTYVHFAEWGLQIIAIAQEWTYVLLQYKVSATMCHQCHNVALVESTDVVLQKYVCPFCRVGLGNSRHSTGMDTRTFAIQRQLWHWSRACHQCHNVAMVESTDVVLQKYLCPFLWSRDNLQAPLCKMDIRSFAIQRQCSRPVPHCGTGGTLWH